MGFAVKVDVDKHFILIIVINMILTLQIQLLLDTDTAQKLKATVERFNEAANWLAPKAYERKLANGIALHKLYWSYPASVESLGLVYQASD